MPPKQKLICLLILCAIAGASLFFFSSQTSAQTTPDSSQTECKSGLVPCGRSCDNPNTPAVDESKPCTLCHLIIGFWNLIHYGFRIMVYLGLAALVAAGIFYIVSAGNEQMTTTAKTFLKNILTGFAVILLAWVMIFSVMRYFLVKTDLGIEKSAGWTKFECSTESTTTFDIPIEGVTVKAKYCCVYEPGKCGHVTDESKCTSGTYHNKACSEINECKAGTAGGCGNENMGFCYDGWIGKKCADGYSWLGGGSNCGSGLYCCVKKSPPGGLCGGSSSGGNVQQGTCQTKPCPGGADNFPHMSDKYPLCEEGMVCCPASNADPAQNLTANPGSVDFGQVESGSPAEKEIALKNNGTSALTISSIKAPASPFSLYKDDPQCADGQLLRQNESCYFTAVFQPEKSGSFSGNYEITYDSGKKIQIQVKGQGVGSGGGGQTGEKPDIEMKYVMHATSITNGSTLIMTVYIKNSGTGTAGPFVVKGTKGKSTVMYTWNVSSLAPGQELSESFSYQMFCTPHSYTYLYHTADADNQITESNETNNSTSTSVWCSR